MRRDPMPLTWVGRRALIRGACYLSCSGTAFLAAWATAEKETGLVWIAAGVASAFAASEAFETWRTIQNLK
jgi:hypothetical protein